MTILELAELTADLLLRYYDNDIQPFLDHCHEDVLWIGPAQGQMVQSKEALVEAFSSETHELRFAVYNLTTYPIYISTHCSEVLLTFVVDTFWPDGQMNRVYQRISFTWEQRKGQPLIRVCHISNAIDYDMRDNIYPVHYLERHPQMTLYCGDNAKKMHFKGIQKSILYTSPSHILYMESRGNHTFLHMDSQIFECNERLSTIYKRVSDSFIRCHSSYLVNPMHVQSIKRFSLTMSDGVKIPVPEKKYTAIKAALFQPKEEKN